MKRVCNTVGKLIFCSCLTIVHAAKIVLNPTNGTQAKLRHRRTKDSWKINFKKPGPTKISKVRKNLVKSLKRNH